MKATALKAIAVLAALATGAFTGANAFSNSLARSQPELATTLSPYAANAYERLAITSVTATADGNALDVGSAITPAREAFDRDGLASEAATIVALGEPDTAARQSALLAITGITLRGRLLNYSLLNEAVAAQDSEAAFTAIDRLLKLYIGIRAEIFPVLAEYLHDESAIPAFVQLLESDPEWADAFFAQASGDPQALANLGRLRVELGDRISSTPATDRRLLMRLANAGEWLNAYTLYERLGTRIAGPADNPLMLDWASDLPPFDWELADERDFHARTNADASAIDVRIDGGRGGVVARRLMAMPPNARALVVEHEFAPAANLDDMTLTVNCVDGGATIAQADFVPGQFAVALESDDCAMIEIVIAGRAWSNGQRLSGTINSVSFLD